jgi:hypothetical protein
MCINDTTKLQIERNWGNLGFSELSNSCLEPAAQFRFRDNGAMLNLARNGCFVAFYRDGIGYYLDLFYIFFDAISLDRDGCIQSRAITQTSWGGLSIRYRGFPGKLRPKKPIETWCAVPKTDVRLIENPGIDPYLGMTTDCNDAEDKRFNFGKFLRYISFPSEVKAAFISDKILSASVNDNRKLWSKE